MVVLVTNRNSNLVVSCFHQNISSSVSLSKQSLCFNITGLLTMYLLLWIVLIPWALGFKKSSFGRFLTAVLLLAIMHKQILTHFMSFNVCGKKNVFFSTTYFRFPLKFWSLKNIFRNFILVLISFIALYFAFSCSIVPFMCINLMILRYFFCNFHKQPYLIGDSVTPFSSCYS